MINIRNLTKTYGEKIVFNGLNGTFGDGFVILSGKSGCGKSTLMKIIAGIEKADCGEVDGVSGNVTLMFQELRLFPSLSAVDNLTAVIGRDRKAEALSLLSELGLTPSDAKKKPDELSGGMNQRVALARAILFDRYRGGNTVILDEPFGKLDGATKEKCVSAVKKYFAGKNVIIITHDEKECDILGAAVVRFDTLATKN